MLKRLKPKSYSMLGIDINSSSIKAIEIAWHHQQPQIVGYGFSSLPANAMDGHTILNGDAITHAIRQILSQHTFTTKSVALALPDSLVFSKWLPMNACLSESDMEELIILEADKSIPYSFEDIYFDFVTPEVSRNNPSHRDVLMVASHSDNVTRRVEAVSQAGLQVNVVDLESYAIERAVTLLAHERILKNPESIIAIMDLGPSFSNVCVLQGKKMIYARQEEFGDKQLIHNLANHYNLSWESASDRYLNESISNDFTNEIKLPYIDHLLCQIKRALQFFFSDSPYDYVDHILLGGNLFLLKDLVESVQITFDIPTSIANPFQGVETNRSAAFLIACGLALRTSESRSC